MKAPQFSRRMLLKAAGSTLCVPFFLKRAFAQAQPRPNLVLLMQTNGVNQAGFWPSPGSFDSPILNKLLTHPQVGPKTTCPTSSVAFGCRASASHTRAAAEVKPLPSVSA